MFDKLIVSDAVGADLNNRRNYFVVSSLVVGTLFLAAVVFSIFASDYGLGTHEFELVEMLPIVDMAAAEPEPSKPTAPQSRSTSQVATRQVNMQDVSQSLIVPNDISVKPSIYQPRPKNMQFQLGSTDTTPSGVGRNNGDPGANDGPGLAPASDPIPETASVPDPPVKVPPPAKPRPIPSLGVINGRAANLVKPVYSAAAKAVNVQGTVEVQVMIDEAGKVVSAHAISGNALLRPSAEVAARGSKFTPTLLSNVPIKVTGVIVYNFIR